MGALLLLGSGGGVSVLSAVSVFRELTEFVSTLRESNTSAYVSSLARMTVLAGLESQRSRILDQVEMSRTYTFSTVFRLRTLEEMRLLSSSASRRLLHISTPPLFSSDFSFRGDFQNFAHLTLLELELCLVGNSGDSEVKIVLRLNSLIFNVVVSWYTEVSCGHV